MKYSELIEMETKTREGSLSKALQGRSKIKYSITTKQKDIFSGF